MRKLYLTVLSIILFGAAVHADTRKILGEKPPVEVALQLPVETILFDPGLPLLEGKIRVTPLEVEVRPGDGDELFFRLDHLFAGAVLASRTISCSSTSTIEKCVEPTANGQKLWVSSNSNERTCGCSISPDATSVAKPFPNELVVDWAIGAGDNSLGAALTSRLRTVALVLGVEFVEGREVTRIPPNLIGYSCVLAFLRFVQEQRGADSILLGIVDHAVDCAADQGRAASVGAKCRFCAVAVIEKACLGIRYVVAHEVAHLLGAHHTDKISHSGHTSGCKADADLMKKEVPLCSGSCDPEKVILCDHTRSELETGPQFMNTQTCEGLL